MLVCVRAKRFQKVCLRDGEVVFRPDGAVIRRRGAHHARRFAVSGESNAVFDGLDAVFGEAAISGESAVTDDLCVFRERNIFRERKNELVLSDAADELEFLRDLRQVDSKRHFLKFHGQ